MNDSELFLKVVHGMWSNQVELWRKAGFHRSGNGEGGMVRQRPAGAAGQQAAYAVEPSAGERLGPAAWVTAGDATSWNDAAFFSISLCNPAASPLDHLREMDHATRQRIDAVASWHCDAPVAGLRHSHISGDRQMIRGVSSSASRQVSVAISDGAGSAARLSGDVDAARIIDREESVAPPGASPIQAGTIENDGDVEEEYEDEDETATSTELSQEQSTQLYEEYEE